MWRYSVAGLACYLQISDADQAEDDTQPVPDAVLEINPRTHGVSDTSLR